MSAPQERVTGEPGLDLRDVFETAARHRGTLLGAAVAAAVITLAVTFALPKWYRATAVILPPEESDLLSNMSLAQRALTKFPSFGILSDYFTPADVYKAILQSRTVQEDIVRAFDLQSVYHQRSLEKTLKALRGNTKVRLNPDGTIAISVEDMSPQRAAGCDNSRARYGPAHQARGGHRCSAVTARRTSMTPRVLIVDDEPQVLNVL